MKLSELQEQLSLAYQMDMENGVAWMNEHAARDFKKHYPGIHEMLALIFDLETIDPEDEDLRTYHERQADLETIEPEE
jgi:hypothetical protein